MRPSGRAPNQLRPIRFEPGVAKYAEGSCLARFGDTHVLCVASVEERVPAFLRNTGRGWITAEYGMLPRSTNTRTVREATRGKQTGRTVEIQRLIGRSLRTVANLPMLGTRSLLIDCDVLQADGGTRTASITGGFIALALAVRGLMERKLLEYSPLVDFVAAASVGIVNGVPCLDLDYAEDSGAAVDMNLVMTGKGHFVEIQGTAEKTAFTQDQLQSMLALGELGIRQLIERQKAALSAKCDLKRLFPAV